MHAQRSATPSIRRLGESSEGSSPVAVRSRPSGVRRGPREQIPSHHQSDNAGTSGTAFHSLQRKSSSESYTPSEYSSDSQSGVEVSSNSSGRKPESQKVVSSLSIHLRQSSVPSATNSDCLHPTIELDSPAPPSLLHRSGAQRSGFPSSSPTSSATQSSLPRRGLSVDSTSTLTNQASELSTHGHIPINPKSVSTVASNPNDSPRQSSQYFGNTLGARECAVPGLGNPKRMSRIGSTNEAEGAVTNPIQVHNLNHQGSASATVLSDPSCTNSRSPGSHASPYLFYEPGLHATAGPLPAPPVSLFDAGNQPASLPPPRPPRLRTPLGIPTSTVPNIRALKESLQLPKAVSDKLAKKSTQIDVVPAQMTPEVPPAAASEPESLVLRQDIELSIPFHKREGAFPPSLGITTSISETGTLESSWRGPGSIIGVPNGAHKDVDGDPPPLGHGLDALPISVTAGPTKETGNPGSGPLATELRHQSSWVSILRALDTSTRESTTTSPQIETEPPFLDTPSPPLPPKHKKTNEEGRNGIPFKVPIPNFKRFSALPRAPSQLSMNDLVPPSWQSRSPSPPLAALPPQPMKVSSSRSRIKAKWPLALQYSDVLSRKSALERSKGYAEKINELALYDCGLTEWVIAIKSRGGNSRAITHSSITLKNGPLFPSGSIFTPQPRHTSQGSIKSEATFPVRPDAYTATDLSTRDVDDVSSTRSPPLLPYPSLAVPRPPNRSPVLLPSPQRYDIPLTASSSKGSSMGFFASFGRKPTLKIDHPVPPASITSNSPATEGLPDGKRSPPGARPAQLSSPPPIPGGPRTLPNRVQRSQTMSVASTPPPTAPSAPAAQAVDRFRHASRRGGSETQSSPRRSTLVITKSSPGFSIERDFEEQVDRLVDLLPNADRQVLAGYLRRTGQDMLAIGQYIEDEKNGKIRRD